MRNTIAVLLTGLLSAPTLVFASERPTGEPTAFATGGPDHGRGCS